MGFFDILVQKKKKANRPTYSAVGASLSALGSEGAPKPETLRNHVRTNSFVNAAVVLRKAQVSSADWQILPKDAKMQKTPAIETMMEQLKTLLSSPNPDGKNTSFAGLLEPVVDDILTLGFGAIIPAKNLDGEVISLHAIDASRVRFLPNWNSVEDGPRYLLMNPDNRTGKPLDNDELITIVLNPTTYNETGYSPVMVLHDKLEAAYDSFRSAWVTQKNRAPAGLLNLDGMPEQELRKVKRLFETELEGNSTIGFINHPMEDLKFVELGSIDLEKQGTTWFMDFLVRNICAAFQVSPVSVQWTMDTNRATAREQLRITSDSGVVPLMKSIAGFINREILGTYQGANVLEFVWSELITKDEAQSADTLRKRAGTTGGAQWVTKNEFRIADGLEPMHTGSKDPLYPFYNEIFVLVGTGQECPVSIAIDLPQYQNAADVLQAQVVAATANRGPSGGSDASQQSPGETPPQDEGSTGTKKPNKENKT